MPKTTLTVAPVDAVADGGHFAAMPKDISHVTSISTPRRMPLDPDALQRRVAWRDGIIELRGETLEQAVAEFNRYRTAKLVVGDPNLAGLRVGGTFGTDEAEKLVGALRSASM